MKFDELFPHVKHSLEDFMFDEEGNIPRSKILAIGSMMIVLSLMLTEKAFAAHRTHSSHRTHSTHRTHSSHRSGGHTTHYTHSTHSTHGTHSTHSNHATHSNHSTHSNAAPSTSQLQVTPPTSTDTMAAVSTNELGVSVGAILPIDNADTIESVNTALGIEVNTPPDTPTAK